VRFTGREGVTSEGCPIAKWVIRRSNQEEKYCIIIKNRYGHQCEYAWIAVSLIQWDGFSKELADAAYEQISQKTAAYGSETERMCGANKKKTCACQGLNKDFNGASYTFGCSWTMYQNVCKFCRSTDVRKFRLKDGSEEINLDLICQKLTDAVTPSFEKLAPDCYNNMCLFEEVAGGCRIGTKPGRPFSGITTVCDFCAHSHKDNNNMIGGCTVVVTLTRPENRTSAKVEDEQFHVLPQYIPDATPEEVQEKVASGGLEVLNKFQRTITVREKPKKPNCKRGRPTAEKKKMLDGYIPEGYTDEKHFESRKGRGRSLSGSPVAQSSKAIEASPISSASMSDIEVTPRAVKIKKPKEVWTTSKPAFNLDQQRTATKPSTDYQSVDITLDDVNDLDDIDFDYQYNNQNENLSNSSSKTSQFPSSSWNSTRVAEAMPQIKANNQNLQINNKIQISRSTQNNGLIAYKPINNFALSNPQNLSIIQVAQNFRNENSAQFQISQNSTSFVQDYRKTMTDQNYGQVQNLSQINSKIQQQPRKIVISNPVIYRPQENQPYIPRIPNIQRPSDVPKNFISNMEAQFDDSILNLLDEPTVHTPSENQHQDSASLIYANYLNNLPQVDGTSDLDPEQIYASYTNRLIQQNNYAPPSYPAEQNQDKPTYYGTANTSSTQNVYLRGAPNLIPNQVSTIRQNIHARPPSQRYVQPQSNKIYNNPHFVAQQASHQSFQPQYRPPPPKYHSVPPNQTSPMRNVQHRPQYLTLSHQPQFVQPTQQYRNPALINVQPNNQVRTAPPLHKLQAESRSAIMQNIPPLTPIRLSSESRMKNLSSSQLGGSNHSAISSFSTNDIQRDEVTVLTPKYERFLSNQPLSSNSSMPSSISSVILDEASTDMKPKTSLFNDIQQKYPSNEVKDDMKIDEKPENILKNFLAANEPKIKHEEMKEEKPSITKYESDCIEAFQDASIGGIALALPHGSILVEVAKHELHATTALKNPNRQNPCRIGLVFYQHKNLHFVNHGADEFLKKNQIREHRDYIQWLKGCFVPSSTKLGTMQKSGFCFPENVVTIKPSQESKPEDRFHPSAYPGFVPGKYVDGFGFVKIDVETDYSYEIFKAKLTPKASNQPSNSYGAQGQGLCTEGLGSSSSNSDFSRQLLFKSSDQSFASSPFNFYSE